MPRPETLAMRKSSSYDRLICGSARFYKRLADLVLDVSLYLAQFHRPSFGIDGGLELLQDWLRIKGIRLFPDPHPDLFQSTRCVGN